MLHSRPGYQLCSVCVTKQLTAVVPVPDAVTDAIEDLLSTWHEELLASDLTARAVLKPVSVKKCAWYIDESVNLPSRYHNQQFVVDRI